MTVKPTVTSDDRQPGKWYSKRRLPLAFLLLAVLGSGFGIYRYRDPLIQWGLERFLQSTPLRFPQISGSHFGINQAEIAQLKFRAQTAAGTAAVALEGIYLAYDLQTGTLDTLNVAHAKLDLVYRPLQEHPAPSPTQPTPALPPLPLTLLHVQSLELKVDSPWGEMYFTGQADLTNAASKLQAVLEDASQTIRFETDPAFAAAELSIQQPGQTLPARLNYRKADQQLHELSLNADASPLLNWLTGTGLIPSNIRADLSASALNRNILALPAVKIDIQARSHDYLNHLQGRMLLTRDGNYLSSTEFSLNTQNTNLAVDGHVDLALADALNLAGPWLPETSQNWQASTGNLIGTFRLKWRPNAKLSGECYLRAYDIGASIGPAKLAGGFARVDINNFSPIAAVLEAELPHLQLGETTELKQLRFKAGLEGQWLSIDKAEFPVFGGALEIVPAQVDIENQPLTLTLGVRRLDLAQLFQSLNYPQLSGTGIISGKLPLRLSKESIEIKEGVLNGTQPGVLRYQGPVADENNIAFKALRNLRYDKLHGKLNYQPTGDYQLGLRLEGKNPELLAGHAVAFNLNLSGHLPELLQKGLMAGDFNQPILEKVKTDENFNKSPP